MGAAAIWVGLHSRDTTREWQERIPSATATIKNVYLTPQLADSSAPKEAPPPAQETSSSPPVTAAVPAPPPAEPDFPAPDGKTYISIIVSGLGLSEANTERAVNDLPSKFSLAFSPYGDNVQSWIQKAARLKHETLILLPMEAASYPQDDPGPRAISSRFSDQENEDNLNWLLSQGKGTVGALNLMGSRFLTDQKRLSAVLETLHKNNSMFIETPGIKDSVAPTIAAEEKLPYMEANLKIDATATDSDIREKLAGLEKLAHEQGYAIGIAEPYPLTLNIIKSWAAGLEDRGITLAPVSTVWKNKPRHEETAPPPPSQDQLKKP